MKQPKFAVDANGFARLQEGREPWTLAKEAVSNSFDEFEVTLVKVTLTKDGNSPAVFTVYDDGKGFADLADAWTMYSDVSKRANPKARGRFDRGEKELLSVALRGSILTTSGSVSFDKDTRTIGRKRSDRGTIVTCELKWTRAECQEVLRRLRTFIPPHGKRYIVNGEEVGHREPRFFIKANLQTPLKDPDTGAFRLTTRNTEILVYQPLEGEEPVLMEMGITVVSLKQDGFPFVVSIEQKVPLTPERDNVSKPYLRAVYAEVLSAVASQLSEEQASAKWVSIAIPDKERVKPETVKVVKQARFGDALVVNPLDPHAQQQAISSGRELMTTRGMEKEERERFYSDGGLVTTTAAGFGYKVVESQPLEETAGMVRTRSFLQALGKEVGVHKVEVRFRAWTGVAGVTEDSKHGEGGIITLNAIDPSLFDRPSARLIEVLVHELAHVGQGDDPRNAYTDHGPAWYARLERYFATLVVQQAGAPWEEMCACGHSRSRHEFVQVRPACDLCSCLGFHRKSLLQLLCAD